MLYMPMSSSRRLMSCANYVPPPEVRGGHTGFSADPVGVAVRVGVGVGVTESCTHGIS